MMKAHNNFCITGIIQHVNHSRCDYTQNAGHYVELQIVTGTGTKDVKVYVENTNLTEYLYLHFADRNIREKNIQLAVWGHIESGYADYLEDDGHKDITNVVYLVGEGMWCDKFGGYNFPEDLLVLVD